MNNEFQNPFFNNCYHNNCCKPRNCCCLPGPRGPQGAPGEAATIAIGSTTTGTPGTNASVTNSGTTNNAILNFVIPRGADGNSATVTVGATTTLPAGSNATVTNSGTSSNAILNFGIPSGGSQQSNLISGSFISRTVQTFTTTNSIIQLPITLNSEGITTSNNGAISVTKSGRYMINYGIKSTTIGNTIGLYINGINNVNTNLETIISDLNPSASIILELNNDDAITLGVVNAAVGTPLILQSNTINSYLTVTSLD